MQIRLDKFFSESAVLSRSEVKNAIKKKLIYVNNTPAASSSVKIDLDTDVVELNGQRVLYEPYVYYVMNKPAGVVSATRDNVHETVIDLVRRQFPQERHDIFPVGRLDIDTEGLLLITNDGQLSHNLLSPKRHVAKTYYVEFEMQDGSSMESDEVNRLLEPFRDGVDIGDDDLTEPAEYKVIGKNSVELTIVEGRFHQVKRMFLALGAQVTYLKRVSFGDLKLIDYDLEPGSVIKLDSESFCTNPTK